ncbi:MAG: MFS transporter [Candidatus Freyarchaeota archaeon]|nr:MFS transporter [Candidatus Jordarchaeia archaeon]MBS7267436.1 MFS transporter [Candidatus Jordarchaeia archaeon]MBS7280374.1 MFS transporter [Candidatus Jordarchaeia archaeon]
MRLSLARPKPPIEILIIVCLSAFIDSLGYGIVVPFLPQYALSLGASDLDLGIIFSSYALVQLVTAVPFGLMSDRYGRRWFMISGMLLLGVASLVYPLAQNVIMISACRAVQGLAASATWSSAIALVADTFPGRDKGEKLGITTGVSGMGSIAGPMVGGALSDINFIYPFLLIATLSLASFIYMFFRLKTPRKEKLVEAPPYMETIKKALGIRNILIIIVINALTTIFWGFVEPLMPPYLSGRFSLSATQIGLIFGVASLSYAVCQPFVGRLSDRYGRKIFIVSGMALLAGVNLAIPFCGDPVSLTLVIMISASIGALAFTPLTPLAIESLQDQNIEAYATVNSLFGIAFYVGYSAGPLIGALISSYFGFESMFFFYSIILVTVLLISQAKLKEMVKKEEKTVIKTKK